jgi:hypothetical protein
VVVGSSSCVDKKCDYKEHPKKIILNKKGED